MSRLLRMASLMATATMLAEASGPVRVKDSMLGDHSSVAALLEAEREQRRERNRQRLAIEAANAAAVRALTTEAEWAHIERAERRRAEKKAAKKANKKSNKK